QLLLGQPDLCRLEAGDTFFLTTTEYTGRHTRNQTKVLRVFFAPSRSKSSPGFTAKPRRAPRARRFRAEKSFSASKGFSACITDPCSSVAICGSVSQFCLRLDCIVFFVSLW